MSRLARIPCPNCPRDLQFRSEYAGRRVACRFCGFLFRLPSHVVIACPECRHEGQVRSENLGHKIRCKACSHAFVALAKRAEVAPAQPGGASPADDARVERLHNEIARRDQALADALTELDDARRMIEQLQARSPAPLADGEYDVSSLTNEWAVIDEEVAVEARAAFPTELDLPQIDDEAVPPLAHPESALDDEPRTMIGRIDESDAEFLALRDECDRLRDELTWLKEKSDRTVLTSNGIETLERSLAIANADNVRLTSERDDALRLVDGMKTYLRDRETAMANATLERDSVREQLDRLSQDHHARNAEIETLRRDRDVAAHNLDRVTNDHQALSAEVAALRGERDPTRLQVETLTAQLAEANATVETLREAPPAPTHSDQEITTEKFYEMARERDQARRELARVRSVLDRLGGENPKPA